MAFELAHDFVERGGDDVLTRQVKNEKDICISQATLMVVAQLCWPPVTPTESATLDSAEKGTSVSGP